MKTKKKISMSLACINENLNTLILNQEKTYFQIQEIRQKLDRMDKKHRVTVKVKSKKN